MKQSATSVTLGFALSVLAFSLSASATASAATADGKLNPFKSVSTSKTLATCRSAAWNATAVYTGGMTASYDNKEWRAKWWTQGNTPSTNPDGPWAYVSDCGGGTSGGGARTVGLEPGSDWGAGGRAGAASGTASGAASEAAASGAGAGCVADCCSVTGTGLSMRTGACHSAQLRPATTSSTVPQGSQATAGRSVDCADKVWGSVTVSSCDGVNRASTCQRIDRCLTL